MNIISVAMALLKHRDSIAKIVAMVPELTNIFNEVTGRVGSLTPPPQTTEAGYEVGSMEWLQESLNTLADADLDVDGEYGPATNKAVHEFQTENGLKADGWAGPETISLIVEQLAAKAA